MFGCSTSARNLRSAMAASCAALSPVLSSPLSTTQRLPRLWSTAREIQPRPPWARQPSTSYCPATSSPGASLGVNENWVPQRGQYPSASPGRPSLPRPTGRSQAPQNRLLSGTCGSARTALAGSRAGTGGTSITPAPRLPRDPRLPADRVRLLPLPLRALPPPLLRLLGPLP